MKKIFIQSFSNLFINIFLISLLIIVSIMFIIFTNETLQNVLIFILIVSLLLIILLVDLINKCYFLEKKDTKLILKNFFKVINIIEVEDIINITIESPDVLYLGRDYKTDLFIIIYYNENKRCKYGGINKKNLPIQVHFTNNNVQFINEVTNYKFDLKNT